MEYEPLPALLDMEEALAQGEVMAHWKVRRGEAAVALERTDLVVVEGTYHTPYQEHAYIEPNGMIGRARRARAASWSTARCSARSTCRRRWPPRWAAT